MVFRKTYFIVCLYIYIGTFCSVLLAQQALMPSGGGKESKTGSISFSIGAIIGDGNFSSKKGSITSSIIQPFIIQTVSKLTDPNSATILLTCDAYPNPTTSYLTIKLSDEKTTGYAFQLMDLSGKIIISQQILSSETRIDMQQYTASCYFLKVTKSNKEIRTFKILKK